MSEIVSPGVESEITHVEEVISLAETGEYIQLCLALRRKSVAKPENRRFFRKASDLIIAAYMQDENPNVPKEYLVKLDRSGHNLGAWILGLPQFLKDTYFASLPKGRTKGLANTGIAKPLRSESYFHELGQLESMRRRLPGPLSGESL